MNKKEFIKELEKQTKLDNDTCTKINEIIENNFIIGKKNKDKIIKQLQNELKIDIEKANKYYETAMSIITSEIKNKIKHPFKNQD